MAERPEHVRETSELVASRQTFEDRDGWIWLDDKLVPWREAQTHVLTHSLHYGGAVFEGARAYRGKVFRLHDHSERLIRSAELIGLEHDLTADFVDEAVMKTLAASGHKDAYVRPLLWRSADNIGVSALGIRSRFMVAVWYWGSYFDPAARLKGIRLEISKWKRPAPDTAPTTAKAAGLYIICTLARDAATANGFDDALMYDYRGDIAEASGANIFFLKEGHLITPPVDNILDGITRRTVISMAEERGLQVDVRRIRPEEMEEFEQCFLTGTAAEVTPVSEIGPYRFEVGQMTRDFVKAYDDLVNGRTD